MEDNGGSWGLITRRQLWSDRFSKFESTPCRTDAATSGSGSPYIVRWSIDGRQRSRSFRTKDDDEPLAATTANRYRTNAHACVLAAVEAGAIPTDPWPQRSRSRARRKVAKPKAAVDVRSLPIHR